MTSHLVSGLGLAARARRSSSGSSLPSSSRQFITALRSSNLNIMDSAIESPSEPGTPLEARSLNGSRRASESDPMVRSGGVSMANAKAKLLAGLNPVPDISTLPSKLQQIGATATADLPHPSAKPVNPSLSTSLMDSTSARAKVMGGLNAIMDNVSSTLGTASPLAHAHAEFHSLTETASASPSSMPGFHPIDIVDCSPALSTINATSPRPLADLTLNQEIPNAVKAHVLMHYDTIAKPPPPPQVPEWVSNLLDGAEPVQPTVEIHREEMIDCSPAQVTISSTTNVEVVEALKITDEDVGVSLSVAEASMAIPDSHIDAAGKGATVHTQTVATEEVVVIPASVERKSEWEVEKELEEENLREVMAHDAGAGTSLHVINSTSPASLHASALRKFASAAVKDSNVGEGGKREEMFRDEHEQRNAVKARVMGEFDPINKPPLSSASLAAEAASTLSSSSSSPSMIAAANASPSTSSALHISDHHIDSSSGVSPHTISTTSPASLSHPRASVRVMEAIPKVNKNANPNVKAYVLREYDPVGKPPLRFSLDDYGDAAATVAPLTASAA